MVSTPKSRGILKNHLNPQTTHKKWIIHQFHHFGAPGQAIIPIFKAGTFLSGPGTFLRWMEVNLKVMPSTPKEPHPSNLSRSALANRGAIFSISSTLARRVTDPPGMLLRQAEAAPNRRRGPKATAKSLNNSVAVLMGKQAHRVENPYKTCGFK